MRLMQPGSSLDTSMYIYWHSMIILVNPYVSLGITTDAHRYT